MILFIYVNFYAVSYYFAILYRKINRRIYLHLILVFFLCCFSVLCPLLYVMKFNEIILHLLYLLFCQSYDVLHQFHHATGSAAVAAYMYLFIALAVSYTRPLLDVIHITNCQFITVELFCLKQS